MAKKARDNRPYIPPVKRLELPESNIRFRWIAIAVLLAIAAVSIGYGFYSALSIDPGWQEVTVLSDEVNCSGSFQLMYDFSAGDINPTAAYKKLETLYKDLTVTGYRLFSPEAEGADNLYALNARLNETVTVAPGLYAALEQIAVSESRYPFMAPVTALYAPVFLSASDAEAALYDPMKDVELAQLAAEAAAYCADPDMIRLEIPGENQARLYVSPEYLAFAKENGIEIFLDFGWMKNAFVADYMADAIMAEGFSHGYLSSYDGFTRNLDSREEAYSKNIFHRVDNSVYMPAVFTYTGPVSMVSLRDYPHTNRDSWNYYAYEDGSITTVFLDPADGASKSSVDGITAYSREKGCGEIALKVSPVFIADSFDAQALEVLADMGIHSIRCHDKGIVFTEKAASLEIADPGYDLVLSNIE